MGLVGWFSFLLVSCIGDHGQVIITPGTDFGRYQKVHITFEEVWMAHHSIVEVLVQELERRSYGVVLGKPSKPNSQALVLHLQNSETVRKWLMTRMIEGIKDRGKDKEEPLVEDFGHMEKLSSIEFLILDGADDQQLAFISYTGRNLDRLEQKHAVRKVADEVFGPR